MTSAQGRATLPSKAENAALRAQPRNLEAVEGHVVVNEPATTSSDGDPGAAKRKGTEVRTLAVCLIMPDAVSPTLVPSLLFGRVPIKSGATLPVGVTPIVEFCPVVTEFSEWACLENLNSKRRSSPGIHAVSNPAAKIDSSGAINVLIVWRGDLRRALKTPRVRFGVGV